MLYHFSHASSIFRIFFVVLDVHFFSFFFMVILEFELMTLCLLGRCYNVAGISSWVTVHWGSLAGTNILLCHHRPSWLVSKGWALRTKRSLLIYPCKQVTEAKSKAQPNCDYMWVHWLFHFPSALWLSSCFNSLNFISFLFHPFPLPHCQNTACISFLALLPATIILQPHL
jgi:hypothetical protein